MIYQISICRISVWRISICRIYISCSGNRPGSLSVFFQPLRGPGSILQRRKEVSLQPDGLRVQPQDPGVFLRDPQGLRRQIRSDTGTTVGIAQQAQQDAAAARAQIQDPGSVLQMPKRLLHQILRVLFRNQHIRRYDKGQSHKGLLPDDIRQRLPLRPPPDT